MVNQVCCIQCEVWNNLDALMELYFCLEENNLNALMLHMGFPYFLPLKLACSHVLAFAPIALLSLL